MRPILLTMIVAGTCIWAQPTSAAAEPSQGSGPFPAVMEQDNGLPTHTIYRPQDLSKLQGQKLPIVAWGNGACVNNGAMFRNFLTEIASYGFLAIAIGPPQTVQFQPRAPAPGAANAPPKPGPPATKSTQLIDAINWAIAENSRQGSKYYEKLDTSKIAVMGQSCGGIQALAVAEDPRIKLIGIWNSGILNAPISGAAPIMEDVRKDQLEKLHSPIFYITGDKSDIAFENGMDDFRRITKVPAFHAYKDGVGHGGTYNQPNGGEFAKVAVALLQWQFKDDQEAAKMFLGAYCGLCRDPHWHVEKKGIQ